MQKSTQAWKTVGHRVALTLSFLLRLYAIARSPVISLRMGFLDEHNTRAHIRWASQALLHICRIKQGDPLTPALDYVPVILWNAVPSYAAFNILLAWSIFLGTPVEEEALEVQDKTYIISHLFLRTSHLCCCFSVCMERVISQLSHAIVTAVPASHPRHPLLWCVLLRLAEWDARPNLLRATVYEWCSAICEEYPDLGNTKELLFLSLRIGFHNLDSPQFWTRLTLVHTKHHWRMVDVVFNGGDNEVVGDFLCAWISSPHSAPQNISTCARGILSIFGMWHLLPRDCDGSLYTPSSSLVTGGRGGHTWWAH